MDLKESINSVSLASSAVKRRRTQRSEPLPPATGSVSIRPRGLGAVMEGSQVAHYRILERLGAGGMGEVYLAEDTTLGRKVAVKFLSPELENDEVARRRFVREARAAAALDHPFICRVYEVAEVDDRPFFAMEYVDGVTLKEELEKGPLGLEQTLKIAAEVAEALELAHSKGFVHRDLKPSNIMLTRRGHARVLDFGLARRIEPSAEGGHTDTQLTNVDAALGTTSYMSPEQLSGEVVTTRSDIFSFGIVLYEMLTGMHPFRRSTGIATASSILREEPQPLLNRAGEPTEVLQRLISGMLTKNAKHRVQSMGEVRKKISQLRHGGAFTRMGRVNPWLWMALAVVFLLVVSALLLIFYRDLGEGRALQPTLRQLTFEPGLVIGPSWSPDGRSITYSSDASGNFDIWVKLISGGSAIQVTKAEADDGDPDWSPDGTQIVFRSSREGGGIYVIPAFGGNARRISSTGYFPRWSPDGRYILIATEPNIGHAEGRGAPAEVIDINGDLVQRVSVPGVQILSAGWHPDGRVSLLGLQENRRLGLWTLSLDGAEAVESEVPGDLRRQMSEGSFIPLHFLWSPVEGDCLYLMAVSGGAPDIFRVAVDPRSLEWLDMPEPLTRSSTLEVGMALSRDGSRLAFTPGTQRVGVWLFPFDASTGAIKGEGRLVSPGGLNASRPDMPAEDDSRLLYRLFTPERLELRIKSLEDDTEELLAQDPISGGRWSRDGRWLCYEKVSPEGMWLAIRPMWGESTDLISLRLATLALGGFSADGKRVLASLPAKDGGDYVEVVSLPVDQAPRAEKGARTLVSHPDLNLWQARSSPDDRWVVFVAIKRSDPQGAAAIYAVPSSGGEWVPITTGPDWNDKPRWAPDGGTIFFISNRGGFFNVWGQRFDTEKGQPVGEPFRVSNFRLPGKIILNEVVELELTLSQTQLALPLTQFFAQNVWVLEGLDDSR